MPIRQLVQCDMRSKSVPEILRQRCPDVSEFGARLHSLVSDLIDTLKHHKIAIGLAAPQIGESTRVVVINLNPNKAEPTLVLVNPIIRSETGKKDKKKESCMSVPGVRGQVERRENVEVQYQGADGSQRTTRASGFLARVICHEVDHLEGRLYINRMPPGTPLEKVDFFDDEKQ